MVRIGFMNQSMTRCILQQLVAWVIGIPSDPRTDNPSGSEEAYDIDSSKDSSALTTREQAKSKEPKTTTSLLSQSEEGGEGTESNSEDPPADDAEKGDSIT
ncbi:hypothetical protein HAX54_026946 [Datura stramonium]|uniref:Uncharacterized protein n=1 Tax=Datura stramonium TaxID=4076 RepID=A0ABS8S8B8_DATST|nr:hypothetical protein [Datura stramonium]